MDNLLANQPLHRLDALVGTWETQASQGDQTLGSGRTVFDWLEGGGFLLQRADAEAVDTLPPEVAANLPFPVWTVMGLEDRTGAFFMLYADARGVCRMYQMTLTDGRWKIWGQSGATFYQRFEGRFSADGGTIEAYWEKSADGAGWERDIDMVYTKLT